MASPHVSSLHCFKSFRSRYNKNPSQFFILSALFSNIFSRLLFYFILMPILGSAPSPAGFRRNQNLVTFCTFSLYHMTLYMCWFFTTFIILDIPVFSLGILSIYLFFYVNSWPNGFLLFSFMELNKIFLSRSLTPSLDLTHLSFLSISLLTLKFTFQSPEL